MKEVVAVVLAGGVGKRFWPLTTPKSLIDFLGIPLVVHNLKLLKLAGLNKVVLIIPAGSREFFLPDLPGLELQTVFQAKPLGMGDAVLSAEKLIHGKSCLIMNATDVVDDGLYKEIGKKLKFGEMFMVGKKVSRYLDVGYLKIKNNKIFEIIEKPGEGHEPSSYVNFVYDYFPDPQRLFEFLKKTTSKRDDVYELALSHLLKKTPAQMLEYNGFWQPLKYPWQVLDIMDYFLGHKLKAYRGNNVEIGDNVLIEGPVYLGDNVRIFENTKIVGPCYIGENTIIGNNNLVRFSQIGNNCVTGFNTDTTRSYVGGNCWFHSNYVGDSVLENNVSLGSGTVLANLRLDEGEIYSAVRGQRLATKRNKLGAIIGRNCRIGVNASIMPGVKIGQGSFVGAGVVLNRDVADGSFAMFKGELEIIENTRTLAKTSRAEFRKRL